MRFLFRPALLGAAVVTLVLGAACSSGDDTSTAGDDPATTTTVAGTDASASTPAIEPSATVRYGYNGAPRGWDPHFSENQLLDIVYLPHVYDRLFTVTPDNEVGPMLATDWSFEDGGRTLRIQLRDDVTFQDGSAFDADVAVANLQRAKSDGAITAAQLTNVTDVVADGPTTMHLTLAEPDPTIVAILATPTGSMISPTGLANPESLQTTPAGSGPFELAGVSATEVDFERNDAYWDTETTYPARKEIHVIADDDARLRAFEDGQLDVLIPRGAAADARAAVDASDGRYVYQSYSSANQYTLFLNSNRPGLDDERVRMAINLAIDRDGIASVVDGCAASSQVFTTGSLGHVDDLPDAYDRDVDQAKQLLTDAGVSDLHLQVLQVNSEPQATIAQIVQDNLADIGIDVELVRTELASARSTWREGNADGLVLAAAPLYGDPSATVDSQLLGGDGIGTPPDELVQLAATARAAEVGSDARRDGYEAVDRYVYEHPVQAFLCALPAVFVGTSDVVGLDHIPGATVGVSADTRLLGIPAG